MSGEPAGWEHFAHEADVGVRGFGPTREAAFEQAAVALMHAIAEPDRIEPRDVVEIACEAPDDALLFVDWLNALIFEVASRDMLFARFEVRLDGRRLAGRAWGEPIDPMRHEVAIEVKGATYTDLKVGRRPGGGWLAQCVVDVSAKGPAAGGRAMDTAQLNRISEVEWQIPPTGKMRVPGAIFADEALIRAMDDKVREQVSNVATLPGIVKASFALPDAHWGYGFPIGGVAAFDPDEGGVISAGGVGFDISCGVRTLLTGVARAEVEPVKDRVADALFRAVPAGLGSKGKIRLKDEEMGAMLEGGARWACARGYGEAADLARIKEGGRAPDARPAFVSTRQGSASRPRGARLARATNTSRCRRSSRSSIRTWPRASACGRARW